MSVQSAMQSGISGLFTNGENIAVVGNNIANVNTIGFKQGRTIFSDMLSTTIGQGQIGRGEQIQSVQNLFTQGGFENTGSATDLAIQGDAMFVLADANGVGRAYSRAGAFTFNKEQILTNPNGYQVQGFGISNGASDGVLAPINLSNFASMAPKPTANLALGINLDRTDTVPPNAWDPAAPKFNPNTSSNFCAGSTVYDAKGNAASLSVYFRNISTALAPDSWEVYTYDGATYTAKGAGIPVTFDSTGNLASVNGVKGGTTFTSNGMTIDLKGSSQYSSPSSVYSQIQDGWAAGSLTNVTVDEKGFLSGMYTNGQQQKLAQIALAKFPSTDGLQKQGASLFVETAASGTALINSSNTDSNKVLSNSLEQSNVDLADQLVKMLTTQRAYSANSKTITTADQMMQETLSLIR